MPNPLVSEAAISSALRSLRIRTVREGRPGLDQLEALMALRGDPLPPVPRANAVRFRKGELIRLVVEALREGPKTVGEVGAYVHAYKPAMPRDVAYQRASVILSRLKGRGLVELRAGVWKTL